jgi:hypothetical protein
MQTALLGFPSTRLLHRQLSSKANGSADADAAAAADQTAAPVNAAKDRTD